MQLPLEEAAEFQRRLSDTGAYRTDPARPHPVLDRLLGRFDAWYYLRLITLIWSTNRRVARPSYPDEVWAAHCLLYLRIVEACGGIFDLSGMDHPARLGRSAVIIGNHMSLMETFLLPLMLLRANRFAAVIKQSLMTYPMLGAVAQATDPIAVGRANPRADLRTVLVEGKRCLDAGRSVLLFPQSTRSTTFDPTAFNTLGVKLAKAAGAPVLPLALKTDFQKNGRLLKDFGGLDRSKVLHFQIGPPLEVTGNGRAAQGQVVDFIGAAIASWT